MPSKLTEQVRRELNAFISQFRDSEVKLLLQLAMARIGSGEAVYLTERLVESMTPSLSEEGHGETYFENKHVLSAITAAQRALEGCRVGPQGFIPVSMLLSDAAVGYLEMELG